MTEIMGGLKSSNNNRDIDDIRYKLNEIKKDLENIKTAFKELKNQVNKDMIAFEKFVKTYRNYKK